MTQMSTEEWMPIPEYPDAYEVSDLGVIRQIKPPCHILGTSKPGRGYEAVYLSQLRSCDKNRWVHRIVLSAFSGPPLAGQHAHHKNGIRGDNRLTNLEWVTPSEHMYRTIASGQRKLTPPKIRVKKPPFAKLTKDEVLSIRSSTSTLTGGEAAQQFGVSRSTISLIRSGKRWQHLLNP